MSNSLTLTMTSSRKVATFITCAILSYARTKRTWSVFVINKFHTSSMIISYLEITNFTIYMRFQILNLTLIRIFAVWILFASFAA